MKMRRIKADVRLELCHSLLSAVLTLLPECEEVQVRGNAIENDLLQLLAAIRK